MRSHHISEEGSCLQISINGPICEARHFFLSHMLLQEGWLVWH